MTPARMSRPSRLYAIADADALAPRSLADAAVAMAEAGVRTIQIRAKSLDDAILFAESERALRALDGWDGSLWIDDRVDLCALLPFAGVQLGQRDLPSATARRLLPEGRLTARSTHDLAQLEAALGDGSVDWIAYGPIFPTRSKAEPDPVVGLDGLVEAVRRVGGKKPLIAIGGIDAGRLPRVLEAGADAAAVISAACAGDVRASCRYLLEALAA